MITVYTPVYNEELLIQFAIDHYGDRFPGCRMVIYDNLSTDNTVKIAKQNGCEIIPFDTGNKIYESKLLEIKNNCWKEAKTDWVVVCDMDELVDINQKQLANEEKAGTTIIRTKAYDMTNMEDNFDIAGMKYGVPSPLAGKNCLFNKKFIQEINYTVGAHSCNPVGNVVYSKKFYKLYHYSSINERRTLEKCQIKGPRLSQENILNGWGTELLITPYQNTPELIHEEYIKDRKDSVKVR